MVTPYIKELYYCSRQHPGKLTPCMLGNDDRRSSAGRAQNYNTDIIWTT